VTDPVDLVFVTLREGAAQTTVGVDPRTGQTRFTEAKGFASSSMGGRFVVLREHEEDELLGYAIVDTSDPDRRIELPFDGWQCCTGRDDVVVMHRYDGDVIAETLLVFLPELRELRVEGAWSAFTVRGTTGDDRRVLKGPEGFYLIEPSDPVPVLLHPGVGWGRIEGETLWITQTDAEEPDESRYEDLSLVAVPLDGSAPTTVLESPLGSYMRLSGGRWALQRGTDSRRADLRIFDPATGHEEVVAEDVDRGFTAWNTSGLLSDIATGPRVVPGVPDNEVIFTRSTSDRTTVWRIVR
jgi:hypothetical protein